MFINEKTRVTLFDLQQAQTELARLRAVISITSQDFVTVNDSYRAAMKKVSDIEWNLFKKPATRHFD